MIRLKIVYEDELDPPGPKWEPTVYDGSYPHLGGEAGDIYINRYQSPPLYYLFNRRGNCELVSRDEIKQWVTGGLMKLPGQVQRPDETQKKPLPRSVGVTE